jgi:1-acyl-sn-glycerol-3-phosphate acyltransferase
MSHAHVAGRKKVGFTRFLLSVASLCLSLPLIALISADTVILLNVFTSLFIFVSPRVKLVSRLRQAIFGTWINVLAAFVEVCGYTPVYSGDTLLRQADSAIALLNHRSFTDTMTAWDFAARARVAGNSSFFAKASLRFMPLVGLAGHSCHAAVFLSRSVASDSAKMDQSFADMARRERAGLPFLHIFFPEGTRRSPKKLAASQAFAETRGLPVLQHCLTPRVKGFQRTLAALRPGGNVSPRAAAVYDFTIYYPLATASTVLPAFGDVALFSIFPALVRRMLCFRSVPNVHIYCRRYEMAGVLTGTEGERAEWLHARYAEKDRLLSWAEEHGSFEGCPEAENMAGGRTPLSAALGCHDIARPLTLFFFLRNLTVLTAFTALVLHGLTAVIRALRGIVSF